MNTTLLSLRKTGIYNPALSEKIQDLTGVEFLNLILPNLITILFAGAGIAAFFTFLIGGIRWITSGGDKTAAESARGTITAGIIGLVIILSLYAIIKLLGGFFGIELLSINIGSLILE